MDEVIHSHEETPTVRMSRVRCAHCHRYYLVEELSAATCPYLDCLGAPEQDIKDLKSALSVAVELLEKTIVLADEIVAARTDEEARRNYDPTDWLDRMVALGGRIREALG